MLSSPTLSSGEGPLTRDAEGRLRSALSSASSGSFFKNPAIEIAQSRQPSFKALIWILLTQSKKSE
jgi:hypothetical protein